MRFVRFCKTFVVLVRYDWLGSSKTSVLLTNALDGTDSTPQGDDAEKPASGGQGAPKVPYPAVRLRGGEGGLPASAHDRACSMKRGRTMIIKAGKTETAARELTVMMSAVSPPRCIHAAKPEKTKKSYPSVTAEETKKIALPEVSRVRCTP